MYKEKPLLHSEVKDYYNIEYAGKICQEFGMSYPFYINKISSPKLPTIFVEIADRLIADGIKARSMI